MNVIFLGPPGAGKGTQAQQICKKFDIPQISTGDILRKAIADGTPTGLKAKEYMDNGKLVPDDIVIQIAKERLEETDCSNGYVLDGFPRTVAQAEALDSIADINFVINIDVNDEAIINRLGGRRVCPNCQAVYHVDWLDGSTVCKNCGTELIQRKDDNEATIKERLRVYAEQTAPLIDYYEKKGKIISIDGAKAMESINAEICKVFEANK